MPSLIDRTGHVHGRLTVLARDTEAGPASGGRRARWLCRCSCGTTVSKSGHDLAAKDTRSCGCLRKEELAARSRTHGQSRSPTYRSWQAALERCHNPKSERFSMYGARGVVVCERWRRSFQAFLSDMGERPQGKTLDRIDLNGPYSPDNCRWATMQQQARNRTSNHVVSFRGEALPLAGVPRCTGLSYQAFRKRIARGWELELAASAPPGHRL